jgi:phosphatidylserine/phosphatidylglycerophosphate/cardiolipin synthase-like enzyme
MRFLSKVVDGIQVFAVSGNYTVSFGITATDIARTGLMGFAIDRTDLDLPSGAKNRTLPMLNSKVFKSEMGKMTTIAEKSMWKHPLQSFVWDDFGAWHNKRYEYVFTPLQGTPGHLKPIPGRRPVSVKVRTEPLFSNETHDVFFNRGVASSQAYAFKYGNKRPDKLPSNKRAEAYEWLSRDLDTAILKFIKHANKGDTLLCCFYEFSYLPVARALQTARTNGGVNVRIILDGKQNGKKSKKTGKVGKPFPRDESEQTKAAVHLPDAVVKWREANPNNIEHNKFMVLLKGKNATPAEVWTGSTNISQGGIFGQTNVGHWIRDAKVAAAYARYWNLLYKDPGAKKGDDRATANKAKKDFRAEVEAIAKAPTRPTDIKKGITPVFSPRRGLAVLKNYAQLVDDSQKSAAITLAFGVGKEFKDVLQDNTPTGPLIFMLLEKQDAPPKPRAKKSDAKPGKPKTAFVRLNSKNNVYEAWGSYVKDPLYQWVRETNTRLLQFNKHVLYIHTKFLLHDPLGDDPIVVTGSANFSRASTQDNDENVVVIRGNTRVADIYFTEFSRLFFHYYYRSVTEARKGVKDAKTVAALFLDEKGTEWHKQYAPGSFKTKRVAMFADMEGAVQG